MLHRAEFARAYPALPPIAVAFLIHALCIAGIAIAHAYASSDIGLLIWAGVEGCAAASLGRLMRLPRWWVPINLLFVPTLYMLLAVPVPPYVYLICFCALLLTNAGACRDRVPLYITGAQTSRALLALLPQQARFSFLDLGSGTGSLLARLAHARPDGRYSGVELSLMTYAVSRLRASRHLAWHLQWGNLWHRDLSGYDVVYAYLSPAAMPRLWRKACREMRPGSLLISNEFGIPGVAPTITTKPLRGGAHRALYVWRM